MTIYDMAMTSFNSEHLQRIVSLLFGFYRPAVSL